MTGYVRQSAADIVPTGVVRAAPINNELNALRDAFATGGGHKHDGTAAEGHPVPVIGDSDLLNKIATDTANNRHGVFVEVGAAAVEQVRFQDGAIVPVTDNDIDLGTSALEFKDLHIDGTANIDSLVADTADINGGTVDAAVIGATTPAAGTFTALTANTSLVAATADINAGTIDGTVIGGAAALAITGTTVTATTGFVGGLTGNVTGNTTGTHTGAVIGNVTGDLTGNVTASTGSSSFNDVVINGGLNMNAGTSATITNLTSPTNTNDAATKGYVDTSISNLVASAPGVLDTLDELAAALGDDANFATTVTNSIATKLALAGGTMSGAIAMGTNKITGLGNPTANQDAATKTYVDTADALKLSLSGGTMSGAIAMGTSKITGLGTPTDNADATTKLYVDGILGSATAAATSAAAAATSASNAATSASNASTSASSASTSATNAAASYDSFDDRYLGSKTSAPTVDNDGNALLTGALYWNSTNGELNVWSGSAWVPTTLTTGAQTITGVKTFSSNPILSGGTASTALALDASKNIVSVTNTGSGSNVLSTSPTLVTPTLGVATATSLQGIIGNVTPATGNFTTLTENSSPVIVQTDIGTGANEIPLNQYLGALAYQDNVSLTTNDITGTLATTNGGTGLTSFTSGGVVYASSTSALATGSALTFNGNALGVTGTGGASAINLTDATSHVGFTATPATGGGFYFSNNRVGSSTFFRTSNASGSDTIPMTFLSGGNVGIGTSSPAYKLDVSGTMGVSGAVTLSGGTANAVAYLNGSKVLTSGSTLYFDGTNLALGTTSASGKLHIFKSSGGQLQIQSDNTGTSTIDMGGTTTPARGGIRFDDNDGSLNFRTNSTTQVTLNNAGNLGLGVTPSAWGGSYKALQTPAGSISAFSTSQFGINQNAYDSGTGTFVYATTAAASRYLQLSGAHNWYTAASGTAGNAITFTQAMTLDANQTLLLGATAANLESAYSVALCGSSSAGNAGQHTFNGQNGNTVMRINQAFADTNARGAIYFYRSGTQVGSITVSSTVTAYNTTSDQRLKENIQNADSASSLIDAIQVRKFDWKESNLHERYGFVAQELLTVVPEAVHQPEDTDAMMSVDYSKLVPMLVKEIQSLRVRVAQLETN